MKNTERLQKSFTLCTLLKEGKTIYQLDIEKAFDRVRWDLLRKNDKKESTLMKDKSNG